uniref:Uncharacterized protein n=1 Tax=Arundo donax TaxID=35708 RepID=A0A0A9TXJ4_ARUDO
MSRCTMPCSCRYLNPKIVSLNILSFS